MYKEAVLAVARRPWLRRLAEEHPAARQVALRFVAGETLEDGLQAAAALNRRGLKATLDHLGENVTSVDDARRAAATYHALLDEIAGRRLDATVSLKLTQLGLDLDEGECRHLLHDMVAHGAREGIFVRIDMESTAYTERTLAAFRDAYARHPGAVGPVTQAYLYRTPADVRALIRLGARVRLCKGAYSEPPHLAYLSKAQVDEAYLRLSETLLVLGTYPALATHDERMIDHATDFARRWEVGRDRFEFQMLFGVRRDLQDRLTAEGYSVRVYVPFGSSWYPYLTRRLAERPANLTFLARALAAEQVR